MKKCQDNKVKSIIDGDTIIISNGVRVRLRNLDTPERGHTGYEQAKRDLAKIIPPGTPVTVCSYARDKFGRLVADVSSKSGDVVEKMKAKGWRND